MIHNKLSDLIPLNLSHKVVVVVEEEGGNHKLIEELLFRTGASVMVVPETRDVIDAVTELKKVDLLILNLRFPDWDDVDAALQIGYLWPQIPMVIQTDYLPLSNRFSALNRYLKGTLVRPWEVSELINLLHRLIIE